MKTLFTLLAGAGMVLLLAFAPGCSKSSPATMTTPSPMASQSTSVTLTGQILSWTDTNGNPLPISGTVQIEGTSYTAQIQGDGWFQMENVSPGVHTLHFMHESGQEATLNLQMMEGGEYHFSMTIEGTRCTVQESMYFHGDAGEIHGMVLSHNPQRDEIQLMSMGEVYRVLYTNSTTFLNMSGPEEILPGVGLEVEGTLEGNDLIRAEKITLESMMHNGGSSYMSGSTVCGMIMKIGPDWIELHETRFYITQNTKFVGIRNMNILHTGDTVEVDAEWQNQKWIARRIERATSCGMMMH